MSAASAQKKNTKRAGAAPAGRASRGGGDSVRAGARAGAAGAKAAAAGLGAAGAAAAKSAGAGSGAAKSAGTKAAAAKSAGAPRPGNAAGGAGGANRSGGANRAGGAGGAADAAPKRKRARAAAAGEAAAAPDAALQPEAAAAPRKGARIEIKGIVFTALGVLMMVAFFSKSGSNPAGQFGDYVKQFVFGLFGLPAYFVPSAIIIAGVLTLLSNKGGKIFGRTFICTLILFVIVSALMHTAYYKPEDFINKSPFSSLMTFYFDAQRLDGGGFLGGLLAMPFITAFQVLGSRILLVALLLIDIILLTNISVAAFLRKAAQTAGNGVRNIQGLGMGKIGAGLRRKGKKPDAAEDAEDAEYSDSPLVSDSDSNSGSGINLGSGSGSRADSAAGSGLGEGAASGKNAASGRGRGWGRGRNQGESAGADSGGFARGGGGEPIPGGPAYAAAGAGGPRRAGVEGVAPQAGEGAPYAMSGFGEAGEYAGRRDNLYGARAARAVFDAYESAGVVGAVGAENGGFGVFEGAGVASGDGGGFGGGDFGDGASAGAGAGVAAGFGAAGGFGGYEGEGVGVGVAGGPELFPLRQERGAISGAAVVDGDELGAALQESAGRGRMNQEVFMKGAAGVVEWMRDQKRNKYDIVLSPESARGGEPSGFSAMRDGGGGDFGGAGAGGANFGGYGGGNGYGGDGGGANSADGAAMSARAGWETVIGMKAAQGAGGGQQRPQAGAVPGFEPAGRGGRAARGGWGLPGAERPARGDRHGRGGPAAAPRAGQAAQYAGGEAGDGEDGGFAQLPWEDAEPRGGRRPRQPNGWPGPNGPQSQSGPNGQRDGQNGSRGPQGPRAQNGGDGRGPRNGANRAAGAPPQGRPGPNPAPDMPHGRQAATEWLQGQQAAAMQQGWQADAAAYRFPEVALLDENLANKGSMEKIRAQTQETAMRLESALQSFKVKAKVIGISRGPSVTRYDMQPDVGVKVNTIMNLAEDISLKLAASGIRIAPVANLAAIGIEVPNKEVSTVYLKEIIESETFAKSRSPLTFSIGKDISGNTIVADIAKMPHLLVAGATGSGKSVCINCLIASLLYKSSPDDVKLILIDPKVVELGIYNGIPHLLIPVVTDPKKAAGALNWAVQEMLSRYKAFSEKKVKDMAGYNSYVGRTRDGEKMPRIVIIIDELADLMMAAAKEVEDYICRLTQMARAAGMHVVIATQRPSVDVITGLIKANIPSRIAFAVSSQIDSRTILDMSGAEKLLGKGDMLFHPVGEKKPVRIQGAFISESEVERVVEYVKIDREADYDEDIMEKVESAGQKDADEGAGGSDELLPRAVEFVVDAKQASTSMIQRKFSVGYARAARIVDQMEARGIVSGYDGSKPRQVLISRQQLYEMKL